jgi:hypothetical protein
MLIKTWQQPWVFNEITEKMNLTLTALLHKLLKT